MNLRLNSSIGRLRLLALLEGSSLLLLIFVAVPLKYVYDNSFLVSLLGPLHGAFFLLYVINVLRTGIEQNWQRRTIYLAIIASLSPFGTFFLDRKVLRHLTDKTA